jgi:hypothetical protein
VADVKAVVNPQACLHENPTIIRKAMWGEILGLICKECGRQWHVGH